MTRKDIIREIGKLEDKLERQPELEDEINQQIREWGKKLQSMENPDKQDPYEPSVRPKKSGNPITREELYELAQEYTNDELAEILGYSVWTITKYKKNWKIRGKNRKPGRKIV